MIPRSIPASAGQPYLGEDSIGWYEVYPRECGATVNGVATALVMPGLSPRVRGNPYRMLARLMENWSIPASAGQPEAADQHRQLQGVYPRECGATVIGGA